jgi:hypothetical protein
MNNPAIGRILITSTDPDDVEMPIKALRHLYSENSQD